MKERRSKLQIYADILNSINNESQNEEIKITRVQLSSKMSFEKVKQYITHLEKYQLVKSKSGLKITNKGRSFMENSEKIQDNVEFIYKMYLSEKSLPEVGKIENQLCKKTDILDRQKLDLNVKQSIKDHMQVQNAMKAIIIELENKPSK